MAYLWKTSLWKIRNSRFVVFLLLMVFLSFRYVEPLAQFSADVDYPVSWCVFPFLITGNLYLCMFYFANIYLCADLPFLQYSCMYQVIRTGRKKWALGNVAGIILRCFAGAGAAAICSLLPLAGHIEWTNEWGKALKTVAMTDVAYQYQMSFLIYYEIFDTYSPAELMGLVLLIAGLFTSFLGVFMYLISICTKREIAVAAGVLLSIMFFVVQNVHFKIRARLSYFVPSIWTKITEQQTRIGGRYMMPPVWYILLVLAAGILLCTLLIVKRMEKIELNWVNEDC